MIRLSPSVTLYHGDCRESLRLLPDNSVDSVPCDPPYALTTASRNGSPRNNDPETPFGRTRLGERGFMGKTWDTGEVAFDPEFWAEVYRVLKPGGHLAAFSASRTYHRMACAIEDAGFEIRDSLMWIYGTGFPKSQNVAKFIDRELNVVGTLGAPRSEHHARLLEAGTARRGEKHEGWDRPWMNDPEAIAAAQSTYLPGSPAAIEFDGFGTALKPAFEPIVLARKPLSEPTVAANVLRWRTGALNIDGCRVPTDETITTHTRGSKAADTQRERGWRMGETETQQSAGQANGRWPANVVTDGSDEVVGMFPTASGQQGRAKVGGAKAGAIYGDFKQNITTNPEPRGDSGSAARFFYSAKASKQDRAGSKHPTVKPISLMQWLARLITPPGGTILDPFAGSGTTGAAAVAEGFSAILCERESEYVADIRRRFGTPRLSIPLDALRAELALLPHIEALRSRFARV